MTGKIFYDGEFLENGRTIDLLSIGLVSDTGAEYYAVNLDADWAAVNRHPWLMDNVVPHLPGGADVVLHLTEGGRTNTGLWWPDRDDPRCKTRGEIREEVEKFPPQGGPCCRG